MDTLTSHDVIDVWETARKQHPVDRALTVLSVALPDLSRRQLVELSVGQRDNHLLAVREQLFGDSINAVTACPTCHEDLEFSLTTSNIKGDATLESNTSFLLRVGDHEIQCRVPTSADLAEIANCASEESARIRLIERCTTDHAGQTADLAATERRELTEKLAGEIAKRDPQSDIQLNIGCVACSHQWTLTFDIESFLWHEISGRAKRLLHEVHVLASAYGWLEADILAMSTTRRKIYLEMAA